jgi:hypothetical protein
MTHFPHQEFPPTPHWQLLLSFTGNFWGAEAILQVRAAMLSEDQRLERYFAERPGNPYRRRRRAQ